MASLKFFTVPMKAICRLVDSQKVKPLPAGSAIDEPSIICQPQSTLPCLTRRRTWTTRFRLTLSGRECVKIVLKSRLGSFPMPLTNQEIEKIREHVRQRLRALRERRLLGNSDVPVAEFA